MYYNRNNHLINEEYNVIYIMIFVILFIYENKYYSLFNKRKVSGEIFPYIKESPKNILEII